LVDKRGQTNGTNKGKDNTNYWGTNFTPKTTTPHIHALLDGWDKAYSYGKGEDHGKSEGDEFS
jgi:hypothetical protein